MPRTENLTIMFTDIVGFTTLTSNQSREQNKSMLRRHDALLLPVVSRYGGRKIKSIGDALLLVFRSPTDAARCGMALQDALAEDNRKRPESEHLHIRVAINVGEVLLERGDVFGEAVNVAARVESLTPPDQIFLTEAVYLSMNKAEVAAEKVSTEQLKGIPEPVTIYRIPSHKVSRLVVAGEEIEESSGELPFGGMHHMDVELGLVDYLSWRFSHLIERKVSILRSLTRRIRSWRPRDFLALPGKIQLLTLAGTLLVVASVAGLYHWKDDIGDWARAQFQSPDTMLTRSESALLRDVAPLINSGRLNEARKAAAVALEKDGADGAANLIMGHIEYARGRRRSGAGYYKLAAESDPTLIAEPRSIVNLVDSLGWVTKDVMPLIKQATTPEMIDALAKRTAQEGYYGRQAAISILKETGHGNRIDRVGAAIQDLRGRKECSDRLNAIKLLRKYQDRRAVPALKEIVNANFMARLKNACLMAEARNTLDELGGK